MPPWKVVPIPTCSLRDFHVHAGTGASLQLTSCCLVKKQKVSKQRGDEHCLFLLGFYLQCKDTVKTGVSQSAFLRCIIMVRFKSCKLGECLAGKKDMTIQFFGNRGNLFSIIYCTFCILSEQTVS